MTTALALFIADGHAEEDWPAVDPCVRNFYMLESEKARPMTGFLATLSPDQQKMALEYDGPENHGDLAAFLKAARDTSSQTDAPVQAPFPAGRQSAKPA